MDTFLVVLLYLLSVNSGSVASRRKGLSLSNIKRVANIEMFGNCPGHYTNFFNNTKIFHLGVVKAADTDFVIAQPDIRRVEGKFKISKCMSVKDTNCELFMAGKVDICKIYNDKGQFYSNIFAEQIKPRMKCPLKEGVYKARNATIGTEELLNMLTFIPEDYFSFYWKLRVDFYETRNLQESVMCMDLVFKVDAVKA